MWPNPQETADLATFTEEILNRKLCFLCSVFVFLRNGTSWMSKSEIYHLFLDSKLLIYFKTDENSILMHVTP